MSDSSRPSEPPEDPIDAGSVAIRRAVPADVSPVVSLVAEYAQEVFAQPASVTPEALLRDGFGSVLEFLVAEVQQEIVGFCAWEQTYDVVAGARGGVVLALYVRPQERGRGIGDGLLRAATRELRLLGATFVSATGEVSLEITDDSPAATVSRLKLRGLSMRHPAADLRRHGH